MACRVRLAFFLSALAPGMAPAAWGAAATTTPALPDLSTVAPDLQVPEARAAAPAAGVRSVQTTADWEGTAVHHTLYLPTDWVSARKFPVLVEYAGNGGHRNAFGDVSEGTVEGCRLGYGISGGRGYLWVCLPFVENVAATRRNATQWWATSRRRNATGSRDRTRRLRAVWRRRRAVVFCGFSRGSVRQTFSAARRPDRRPLAGVHLSQPLRRRE